MRENLTYSTADLRRYISRDNFNHILSNANDKYNSAIWRRYADWGIPSNDKEWIQGQKETPIMVRASVLGTHSNKPQRNEEGWKFYGGSIMKMGHGFSIDEDDLFLIRKNEGLTKIPQSILLTDTVQDKVNTMIGGVHAQLNYVTLQALSTGEIKEVSVDGAAFDYKFPINDKHFMSLSTGDAWFSQTSTSSPITTNTNANPIKDILEAQRYMTMDLNLSVDHWKISKELFDRLLNHPKVIETCVARGNFRNVANIQLSQKEVLQYMHDMGIWAFDVIDYKSRHEENGVAVIDKPAFDVHNMVACNSNIVPFEMKCTNSIHIDRTKFEQIGSNHNYFLVEDRIMVLSSTEERPFKNIVDCELYASPVFNNIREIGFFKVWGV